MATRMSEHDVVVEEEEEGEEEEEEESARPLPIRDAALREILMAGFSQHTKITPPALGLSSILIRCFVEEAWHRAAMEASDSGDAEITPEHLEKILAQLLLDMGP